MLQGGAVAWGPGPMNVPREGPSKPQNFSCFILNERTATPEEQALMKEMEDEGDNERDYRGPPLVSSLLIYEAFHIFAINCLHLKLHCN